MRLLTFQARHFAWQAFSKTLDNAPEPGQSKRVEECVVVFLHIEGADEAPDARARVFKRSLKHVKWLANKRDFKNVVLHSFTHLGAENASSEFALSFMNELAERLRTTNYSVQLTPFGYFCEWEISVYGESLAKVWKEF
jgi:hypothetical protein